MVPTVSHINNNDSFLRQKSSTTLQLTEKQVIIYLEPGYMFIFFTHVSHATIESLHAHNNITPMVYDKYVSARLGRKFGKYYLSL